MMGKTSAKIKRPLWVAGLNIALALTVGSTQAFANTPITNQTQLEAIGSSLTGNYVLESSFEVVGPISGGSTYVSGTFTGTFDGGGYIISGLTKPLFNVIDGDELSPAATISDLTLIADTNGVSGAGILAVVVYTGTVIDNVHVIGNVIVLTGIEVGGLVGVSDGNITNSSATGNVSGNGSAGGLVGFSGGDISNSYATGDVNGANLVGGLVGDGRGDISNSYATGDVNGADLVGGLVGVSAGTITESYATGDVNGADYVGGLVGWTFSDISNSYASGNVTGDRVVGGLAGTALGEISNSYASGNVEADDISDFSEYFGGLAAEAYQPITNSYASGNVTAVGYNIDGLVGLQGDEIVFDSYASGNVNGTPCGEDCSPLNDAELLEILNTGFVPLSLP